jgi:hypothetical protein
MQEEDTPGNFLDEHREKREEYFYHPKVVSASQTLSLPKIRKEMLESYNKYRHS